MQVFKKILDIFIKIVSVLLICLVCGIVVLMLNELFMRNFLNKSFRGMTEMAGFMFLWMAFLGITVLYDQERLITLDILYARFSPSLKGKIWYVQQLVAFGLGIIMIIAFAGLYPFVITEFYSSMPKFSKMWQFLPLAISGAYLTLKSLYNVINKIISKKSVKTGASI